MKSNWNIYKIECGKHVFLHYQGAIREAIFEGTLLDLPHDETRIILKIAGLEGSRNVNGETNLYYSELDAIEEIHPVETSSMSLEELNEIAPARINSNGSVFAWTWQNTRPVERQIYFLEAVYIADKVSFVKPPYEYDVYSRTTKHFPPSEFLPIKEGYYKTKEECRAHNRAEVIRF